MKSLISVLSWPDSAKVTLYSVCLSVFAGVSSYLLKASQNCQDPLLLGCYRYLPTVFYLLHFLLHCLLLKLSDVSFLSSKAVGLAYPRQISHSYVFISISLTYATAYLS